MKSKRLFFFAILSCLSITSCSITNTPSNTTTSEPVITSTTSEEETTTSDSSSSTSSVEQTYTVTWKNDDGTNLEIDARVRKGDTPTFDNGTPSKDDDKRYTYEFIGWSPEISPVEGDVTYTAQYKVVEKTFTITWKNSDGTVLEVEEGVKYDSMPEYKGDTPTLDETENLRYEFDGWEPEFVQVEKNATYTAKYKTFRNQFNVTWFNEDGSELETDTGLRLGDTPSYDGETPTKAADSRYTYEFAGWTPEVTAIVNKNVSYTATYRAIERKFTVTWVDEDGKTVLDSQENITYGSTPEYKGETPTKADGEHSTFEFSGWNPTPVEVTSDVTYTAKYKENKEQFTITWLNEDGTLIEKTQESYGEVPSHNGPTKADEGDYAFTFDKWTPTLTEVTGEATYTASYTKRLKDKFPDTIYFTSNKGWNVPYVYAWNSTSDVKAAWPGTPMKFHVINQHNEYVFSLSGISAYKYIIFNNGNNGEQTVDLTYTDLAGGDNAFYLDSKNSSGNYTAKSWSESGEKPAKLNYNFKDKGQNILHCFDWPLATIKANLDDIAAQGFNAIQTSPLQPCKDYQDSYNDTNDSWWRFYQPVGLCIGTSTTNNLIASSDVAGAKAELKELTEEAAKRGIRIIVDVIVNHLADGSGNGGLNTQVKDFSPDIYNGYSETLHNPGYKKNVDYGTIDGLVLSDAFGKDLNTKNTTVKRVVKEFLQSLVQCGVTGFRFDAAKHIETSNEGYGYDSDFWSATLGEAKKYAKNNYNMSVWAYGEILNPGDAGRNPQQYLDHSGFDAITAPMNWWDKTGYEHVQRGLDADDCVWWGESHDDYMGSEQKTRDTSQADINENYKNYARYNKDLNMLYFVRPEIGKKIRGSTSIGDHPEWGWKNGQALLGNSR